MLRRTDDKFMLRLPDGLRSQIKAISATNRRSMNSEIIYHLEKAVLSETVSKKGDASA